MCYFTWYENDQRNIVSIVSFPVQKQKETTEHELGQGMITHVILLIKMSSIT